MIKFYIIFFIDKWIKRNCPHFCIGCKYRKECIDFIKRDFKLGNFPYK